MHIAHPHQQEEIQSGSGDSNYNTPPGDDALSKQTLSTTGPVMQSQTRACQLAQSVQDAWIELKQSNTSNESRRVIPQGGWQITDGLCHEHKYWLSIA